MEWLAAETWSDLEDQRSSRDIRPKDVKWLQTKGAMRWEGVKNTIICSA
jgi:hypothetical protein